MSHIQTVSSLTDCLTMSFSWCKPPWAIESCFYCRTYVVVDWYGTWNIHCIDFSCKTRVHRIARECSCEVLERNIILWGIAIKCYFGWGGEGGGIASNCSCGGGGNLNKCSCGGGVLQTKCSCEVYCKRVLLWTRLLQASTHNTSIPYYKTNPIDRAADYADNIILQSFIMSHCKV